MKELTPFFHYPVPFAEVTSCILGEDYINELVLSRVMNLFLNFIWIGCNNGSSNIWNPKRVFRMLKVG